MKVHHQIPVIQLDTIAIRVHVSVCLDVGKVALLIKYVHIATYIYLCSKGGDTYQKLWGS